MTNSSADSDLLFQAYGKWIADLFGVATPASRQRLHLAPLSDYAIPSGAQINQNYQNWNIYRFANSISRDDQPLLSDSGTSLVLAYATYLADVDLSSVVTDRQKAAVAAPQADLQKYEKRLAADIVTARTGFKTIFPNGIDDTTGDAIIFAKAGFRIAADCFRLTTQKLELVVEEANQKLSELLHEQGSSDLIDELNIFRSNLKQGQDEANSHPTFNFPVNLSNPSQVTRAIEAPENQNSTPLLYEPAFTIGGDFDSAVEKWVATFPVNYPSDRRDFDKKLNVKVSNGNDTSWEDLRFSTSTSTSGTSGWIFWSHTDTNTKTTISTTIDINRKDFTSDITVKFCNFGAFPVQYGACYTGSPVHTFPKLNAAGESNPAVKSDLLEQFATLFTAYSVEISFTLSDDAYSLFSKVKTEASSHKDGLSIFSSIYSSGDSSGDRNESDWSDLRTNDQEKSIMLLAKITNFPSCSALWRTG